MTAPDGNGSARGGRRREELAAVLGFRPASVRRLGAGQQNVAYVVDDRLVVRLRRSDDGLDVESEAGVLRRVADISPVPVPDVVAVDSERGAIVHSWLPGES